MKLKKIASLMLAGIMAVSMLAGCKSGTPDPDDNGGASSNTTSSFTQSVLSKTNAKTSALLKASSNAKLDAGVEYAAKAGFTKADAYTYVENIKWADGDGWTEMKLAATQMDDAKFLVSINDATKGYDFSNEKEWTNKTKTYWSVGLVSASLSDDAIANMVADLLDNQKFAASDKDDTYTYEVRAAKALCENSDKGSANDDFVIVGIAITCTHADVKY